MARLLSETTVLFLDCQSTGANPEQGSLLELGWASGRGSEPLLERGKIETRLVELPEDEELTRRISQLTGITAGHLEHAVSQAQAWESLATAARKAARQREGESALTVIHFARFEQPFLRDLFETCGEDERFPFEIVCTHEIARRMLPELPRRGLRALAGYFGHTTDLLRRSGEHVAATAFVWARLTALLDAREGIRTLTELRAWLNVQPPSASGCRHVYPMAREKRLNLPDAPGVYRMLRGNGDLLYVGKATSLKRRVNSYFQKQRRIPERTLEMLTQARDLEVTVTGSALEAALLESDEIKRKRPPYNVQLLEGRRQLCFASPDFTSFSSTSDIAHPLGPLPDHETIKAFSLLLRLLDGPCMPPAPLQDEIRGVLVAAPAEAAPDSECLLAGLAMFRDAHLRDKSNAAFARGSLLSRLQALGTGLWLERLKEIEAARVEKARKSEQDGSAELESIDAEGDGAEVEEEAERFVWEPEIVCRALGGVVRRMFHMLRRAHWVCRLSESTLVWQSPGKEAPGYRRLHFEAGHIAAQHTLSGPEMPAPLASSGYAKIFSERRRGFDLATFERMNLLTAQLRRLVGEAQYVRIEFGPRTFISQATLGRILRWV